MVTFYQLSHDRLSYAGLYHFSGGLWPFLRVAVRKLAGAHAGYTPWLLGLDNSATRPKEVEPSPKLERLVDEVIDERPMEGLRPLLYFEPPCLDPGMIAQSAAVLSRDGLVGLRIDWVVFRTREIVHATCTTRVHGGRYVISFAAPGFYLAGPPEWEVAARPPRDVPTLIDDHRDRLKGRAVEPFRAEEVPEVIAALDRAYFEANVRAGYLVPMSDDEVEQARRGFRS